MREREIGHRNGEFFRIVGEESIRLAGLLYLEEQPPSKIVDHLRHGVADLSLSYELGEDSVPETVFLCFGAAVAAQNRGTARFFATLPLSMWGFPTKPEGRIDSWIVRIVFSLYLGQESDTATALELLDGLIFETEIPEETAGRKKDFEAWYRILEALKARNAKAFADQLLIRQELRASALKEAPESEPLDLIDWTGLALCQMGLDSGMRVELKDVYLPLELLKVPAPVP